MSQEQHDNQHYTLKKENNTLFLTIKPTCTPEAFKEMIVRFFDVYFKQERNFCVIANLSLVNNASSLCTASAGESIIQSSKTVWSTTEKFLKCFAFVCPAECDAFPCLSMLLMPVRDDPCVQIVNTKKDAILAAKRLFELH